MAISLDTVSSGYNLSAINDNFTLIQEFINDSAVWRTGSTSGETTMVRDLDMNSYAILNYKADTSDSTSLITIGEADARYYKKDGDTLTGTMQANGQSILGLPEPTVSSQAATKQYVDEEASYRASADANIQSQLTGNVPLEASAFSEISWHGQQIANSVDIPDNKNAWSFGPQMEIEAGQVVTVGDGSAWTIADGREVESDDLHSLIADTITTTDGSSTLIVSDAVSAISSATKDITSLSSSVTSLQTRMTAEESKVQPVSLGGTGFTSVCYVEALTTTAVSLASSTFTMIIPTEVMDTLSAYNSGVFTAPSDGYYHIRASARLTTPAATTTASFGLTASIGASSITTYTAGKSTSHVMSASDDSISELNLVIKLTSGQLLRIFAYQDYSQSLNIANSSINIIRL